MALGKHSSPGFIRSLNNKYIMSINNDYFTGILFCALFFSIPWYHFYAMFINYLLILFIAYLYSRLLFLTQKLNKLHEGSKAQTLFTLFTTIFPALKHCLLHSICSLKSLKEYKKIYQVLFLKKYNPKC